MIIGDELGIGHDPGQHAAYVASWIKVLQDDPLEIFRAAADAEKIQEYVLGLEHQQKQQREVPMETARQTNDYEQAVTLARLREANVKADPNSTREEIVAAREDRKLAELVATLNDEELLKLKARYDEEAQAALPIFRENKRLSEMGSKERQYLAVPYGERSAARAAGAWWDPAAKSWYVGPKANLDKLRRWFPENVPIRQDLAMTPREEFAEALRALGCIISGDHPIMDGNKHRITVEGEKHSENSGSGFYVGHLDGHPAGYIKNNRTGVDLRWKSKGYALDDSERARLRAEAAEKLSARAAEQDRSHEAAAQRVTQQIAALVPAKEPTAYMKTKGMLQLSGFSQT